MPQERPEMALTPPHDGTCASNIAHDVSRQTQGQETFGATLVFDRLTLVLWLVVVRVCVGGGQEEGRRGSVCVVDPASPLRLQTDLHRQNWTQLTASLSIVCFPMTSTAHVALLRFSVLDIPPASPANTIGGYRMRVSFKVCDGVWPACLIMMKPPHALNKKLCKMERTKRRSSDARTTYLTKRLMWGIMRAAPVLLPRQAQTCKQEDY